MATNFSPCKGSYVLNQFPSNVMFAMNGFTYQPVERYRAIMALLLKIENPAKRDATVKEFLELKKNIRNNLLSERVEEMEVQKDLSKKFRPITETQREATKEITEELKPIKEGIDKIPKAVLSASAFPAFPSIKEGGKNILELGPIPNKYLRMFTTKDQADTTFGLYDKDGKFYIGDKLAVIDGDDLVVGRDEYVGTEGLWELLVSKNPDPTIYDDNDKAAYKKLMLETNSLYRGNNPRDFRAKGNYRGVKWENPLGEFWGEIREKKKRRTNNRRSYCYS